MEDLLVRLLVVGSVAAAALGSAWVVRSGATVRRSPFKSIGLNDGVHLFSASACQSCGRARAMLLASGRAFEEHVFESEQECHAANGIDRVPAIAWVPGPESSQEAWIAMGVPSARTLNRWLGP